MAILAAHHGAAAAGDGAGTGGGVAGDGGDRQGVAVGIAVVVQHVAGGVAARVGIVRTSCLDSDGHVGDRDGGYRAGDQCVERAIDAVGGRADVLQVGGLVFPTDVVEPGLVHHQQEAEVVGHVAVAVRIAVGLRGGEVDKIGVGPEVETADHPVALDWPADPAEILLTADADADGGDIVAAEQVAVGVVADAGDAQARGNEVVAVRLLAGRSGGDIDSVGVAEAEIRQLDLDRLAFDLQRGVVIVGRKTRCAGVGSGDYGSKALAFVSCGVHPLVQYVVDVVTVLLDQKARYLLYIQHIQPVTVDENGRCTLRPFRGVGSQRTVQLRVVEQRQADVECAAGNGIAQLREVGAPLGVGTALLAAEQGEQLLVARFGQIVLDQLRCRGCSLAQGRVVLTLMEQVAVICRQFGGRRYGRVAFDGNRLRFCRRSVGRQ
ncbi:hypothetical protein D3C84_238670 [compost metagenome]